MADPMTPSDGQGTTGAKQQVVAYTEKSQDKHESRHIQLVREYGFHPRSKVQVEDGAVLPRKFEPFPDDMYGRPLEEIDNFIYEETFCVVSKRFRKNYIHRFTGTKSLFCFTPWSPTRRACVYLATNQFFDYFVMATILFNCIFLAMSETIEEAEYIFLAIYTSEMIIKMIAKGFILNKYTYLRNPWNWLDFVVITSGYATIALDVGNLAGLRTFRVLRALKTVSIMPGLKTIINALLHSFKQLAEVMTLTIFCLMVFALFALQVYMGELRNKCVKNMPEGWNITHDEWRMWVNDTDNWIIDDEGIPMLCGNLTGARHCPPEYTCLCVGENPNHGYTNFDNFMWSMLTTFQLITLDYWENVYNMVLATCGPMSVSFFTVVVFFGSFYLINLMLAVVALSYEEEAEITQEERRKDLIDHRDDSTFSFDPASLNVRQLSKQQRKKLDARKGVLLASYSRKKTRRRKKGKDEGGRNGNNYSKSRSATPSPSPSPRHSIVRPQALALQRTKGMLATTAGVPLPPSTQPQNPNTLHPLGPHYRGQLLPSSRQASSNASEGGGNRESSLDDSGVVDDHEEQDVTATDLVHPTLVEQREVTPVTLALSPREVRIIKCNGNLAKVKKHNVYALHPEYLSQIVVLDDLPDRNCDRCVHCCVNYERWLQFQNCLYKIVRDPLFELGITLCIVLNTLFLALEHHGMNESVRDALDIGNRVFTSVFTLECILKVLALSKDFFLCGWNIFDLIIVSASLLDLIFELMEGLTVLRGLRLLRVLKLAQSWTTMKVLLSIIISTIGALGNLTFVLVIVIYIFAVIGMQLFSKDYTPEKFAPDPVPRWNFNDFFHSFMMIFRILCGEWIEPLWDCMRAEEEQGASTCFAIFLPALVMGNFMVLNLFLALLLNSFNSEELKSKKESFEQEVGEDSKLARSFERIRSIVRKKRKANKEKNENDTNTRLERLVNEIVIKQREEKRKYSAALVAAKDTTIVLPADLRPPGERLIYGQSYQDNLIQRLPTAELCYEIPLKDRPLRTISGSQETVSQMDERQLPDDGPQQMTDVERKILQQMSSGFGTQQSKDEPTVAESLELRSFNRISSSEIDPNEQSIHISGSQPYDEAYLQYQKSLLNRSPSYRKSLDRTSSRTSSVNSLANSLAKCHSPLVQEVLNAGSTYLRNSNISLIQTPTPRSRREDNHFLVADRKSSLDKSLTASPPHLASQPYSQPRSPSTSSSMRKAVLAANRLSDQSLNTLSIDQDDLMNQMNLKDELLNCEQKELFQFLNDDFDNSNNYFSETVGYGSALVEADTESLLLNGAHSRKDELIYSPDRKISNGSLKSNLSSISNSIFQALEHNRGGSVSEPMEKQRPTIAVDNGSLLSRRDSEEKEPLVKASEFDDIIHSFDTELKSLKSLSLGRSHSQTEPAVSPEPERRNSDTSPAKPVAEEVVRLRRPKSSTVCSYKSSRNNSNTHGNNTSDNDNNDSNVCNNNPRTSSGNDSNSSNTDSNTQRSETSKRRSLEKQRNITDEEFNMGLEIKKLCDQLQAPFATAHSEPNVGIPGGTNNLSTIPIVFRRRNDFHSSFDRIKRLSLIERVEEGNEDEKAQPPKPSSEQLPRKNLSKDRLETLSLKSSYSIENGEKPLSETNRQIGISIQEFQRNIAQENSLEIPKPVPPLKKTVTYGDTSRQNSSQIATPKRTPYKSYESDAPLNLAGKPWHCLVSYVDDITVGGRRNSQGVYDDPMAFPSFGRRKAPKIPQDCFPQKCYEKCKCWEACLKTDAGQRWYRFRQFILQYVDTPAFEWFVLVLIFASSITLCFEDIHLDKNKSLKRILYWTNFAFCLIFIIEMLLKWVALGFAKYFSSFWTILDFIIVFVSVFSLLIEENENLKVLRSLRTLRALRPLRAISRWQGMRIVVNALMYAIPSIFNVLLVCLVFWLIFSIMGVQFFGGKFFKCVDDDGELLPIDIVNDKWQCYTLNYSWINSKITFDHVGMGYLALFQVATFEGWMEVMADAVDARGVDLQPQREANLYAYIYFVIFIVCGSFFTLNLFIGVIIDNFNMLKKKYEGGVLEMFLTESQKHYYTAMKKLGRKKPQKVIKRPINQFLAMFYDLSNSRRFEIAIFVLIFLNMLTMGIEHYNQPHAVFFVLEVSNAFFTTVFGLEAIVKIVGLRYHYFTVPWNVFDFLLVLASIFGILMEDIMIDLPISPTLLRVVRVFRIGRILRLIKAAKGIRKLLFALVVSLPALFNIGALLALITFIYAIIGMSLFGHVRQQGALDDMVNFETFGRSMQLLFRLMTSAGWNDVLESLMIQPPDCALTKDLSNGDCGHPLLAITYFTSFIIISYMIVINMYIAIILENFNQAHQEEEVGIVEDDLEMFYIRWSKYDPHAGQFIHFNQLSDFIASLDPPLGIPKPNTVALVSFNLPISKGNKIHCLDILHALVKHVLGHVEETDNFKQLQDQMDQKFKKQFPTRKELEIVSSTRIWKRQEKAARTIQNTWREYLRLKSERERSPMSLEDENTQTSSPGGWQSKLSALNFLHLQVHRRGTATSSRASSRKSSRASDDSNLSELAGPWLNLPLMLVSGTSDMVKEVKQQHANGLELKDTSDGKGRRRSFYNFPFFLRHQDAVEETSNSPQPQKRSIKGSDTNQSLNTSLEKPVAPCTPTPKHKRATSFVKKKPPLERGFSAQSALRLNRNASVADETLSASTADVSILVTEPSPDVPTGPNLSAVPGEATLVHVLVHRESEEYQSDVDEKDETKVKEPRDPSKASDIKISPGTNIDYQILGGSDDVPRPVVTICVESPQESPDTPEQRQQQDAVIDIIDPEPIDVNLPRDTTNIFYDYEEPIDARQDTPEIHPRSHPAHALQDLDRIEYDTQQTNSNTSSVTSSNSSGKQTPPNTENPRICS
ncbi:sodium channel protein 60E isoform X1 [Malaya genurostris]|uniref:sodium channel protein 60E isoform X1 n=1 Tax=Malaya genurostris TaxID=325434 RepID=UPI0026F3AA94|nr:sodium channel protein 60E isoform X1 [Malaya genurostris]XP_058466072.1 sodium channel protein 60E isoform X1 [Malaya genurostris]XP_058466073.1 sodium channel protein 60E isoform X1 [Malaya genurostris]XP_058466074.1 sodium channel protein 60E isoform X1 [Malaya genurostris]XP_058466075.1 sodium channel protein 60E isoform X1 [Malaya genurostris]